jgi:anti-sigma factor RsiW
MSNDPGPCLKDTEILDYLDGGLPEARQAAVAAHVEECRLCAASVEGVSSLEWRDGFLSSTESLRARVRARVATMMAGAPTPRPTPRFRRPAPQHLALAATLVLGVGMAVVLTRPIPGETETTLAVGTALNRAGSGETLFRRHFEPYPSTRPLVRGMSDDRGSHDVAGEDAVSSALALYQARDYRGALSALEERRDRPPRDPMVLFYAGVSRLALGHAREARQDLEQVALLGESEFRTPAEWYLALAHLRNGDIDAARSRFERIAEAGGFYRAQAQALLSEWSQLDRKK